jgi:hypothetical protein
MTAEPMSREFLISQGRCCMNECQNCPYKEDLTKQGKKENDIGLTRNKQTQCGADGGRRTEAN